MNKLVKIKFIEEETKKKHNDTFISKRKGAIGGRVIFEDDFSAGSLDKWNLKSDDAEIMSDGKHNILSLSNPAHGLGVQIEKAVDDYALVEMSFFFKLETSSSVCRFVLFQGGYGSYDTTFVTESLQTGQWYKATAAIYLPNTSDYVQPLNIILYGGSESDADIKTFYRDVKVSQLEPFTEIYFNEDGWENYFQANSNALYQRENDFLKITTGQLPIDDSDSAEKFTLLKGEEGMPAAYVNMDGTGEEYTSGAFFIASGSSDKQSLYAYADLVGGGNELPGLPVLMTGDNDFYTIKPIDTANNSQPNEIDMTISLGAINTNSNIKNNVINVKRYAYLLGKTSITIEE